MHSVGRMQSFCNVKILIHIVTTVLIRVNTETIAPLYTIGQIGEQGEEM
jgi:hypothetical protein